MPKLRPSNQRAWLYIIAMLLVVSFLVRYGMRMLSQLRGTGEPSLFSHIFAVLMIGFAALILYGYWTEYWSDVARGEATSRPQYSLGCLLVLVIVSAFACGLLVLAWKMFRTNS